MKKIYVWKKLKVKKNFLEYFKRGRNVIDNGGWHFNKIKKPIDIKKKIESFAHSELNKEKFKNIENIEKNILQGADLYNTDLYYSKIPIDNDFPKYLIENLNKYKEWIADWIIFWRGGRVVEGARLESV